MHVELEYFLRDAEIKRALQKLVEEDRPFGSRERRNPDESHHTHRY